MFDYDLGSGNDFMGKVCIPLSHLSERKEVRQWYKLGNKEGTNDGKDYGQLLLSLWHVNDPASKPPLDSSNYLDDLEKLPPAEVTTVAPPTVSKKEKVKKEKKPPPVVIATYGNWQETIDGESREIYWFNKQTRKSTWQEPEFVKAEKKRLMLIRVVKFTKASLLEVSE